MTEKSEIATTIWKFPLLVQSEQHIEIPQTHEYLSVQMQAGKPCLWAIVDPGTKIQTVRISCHPTGGIGAPSRNDDHKFLGTVQIDWTVWHFFGYGG